MRVKQLRAILDERGVECKGCAEKWDFVERAKETYHLPVKAQAEESDDGKSKMSEEEIKAMMDKMNKGPSSGDPEKDAILSRLHKKGIKFAGGEGMSLEQLKNLESSMGAFNMGGGGGGGKDDL